MPERFLPDLSLYPVISCDSETTGLQWWMSETFGLSFAWQEDEQIRSIYVDIREERERRWAKHQIKNARKIVNHNIKFDYHCWRELGITVDPRKIECTMIREALINEHRYSYGLDAIAKERVGRGKEEIWGKLAAMFGGKPTKDVQILNLHLAPPALVEEYACPDAELALLVWESQNKDLSDQELWPIHKVEHELLEVVIDMECRGVRVDLERARILSKDLREWIIRDQRELNRLVGMEVNVNSNPQVIRIVAPTKDDHGNWKAKDGTPLESTDGGNPSVRTHALHNMKFREAELIASIRGMIKAKDVFVDKYVLGMNHEGYIHATINQTKTENDAGTGTGRFSITEPALQQIHKRDKKMASLVRSLFLPDRGQKWLCLDYSQIDFRCFVHYVNSPRLVDAYAQNPDIDYHGLVSGIVGVPRDRDERTGGGNAKQLNLGLVFGMGAGRMAREMGLDYYMENGYYKPGEKAQELFSKYHAEIPGVEVMRSTAQARAKARGYVTTPLGRRVRFPKGYGAHKAAGLIFQSAAADILKYKMIEVYHELKDTDARLMLTVHDEFGVSFDGNPEMSGKLKALLERFDGEKTKLTFRVPIRASLGVGETWWEASK